MTNYFNDYMDEMSKNANLGFLVAALVGTIQGYTNWSENVSSEQLLAATIKALKLYGVDTNHEKWAKQMEEIMLKLQEA